MAQTVSLFQARHGSRQDWTNQELAEFYRVETALSQAGLKIFSDRGISDEGDPWFVFCRAPDGEIVIHFARHDRLYVIASDTFPDVLRGPDFRTLINRFAGQHPSLMALPPSPNRNRLFLHPSAMLAAIVATAFFCIQPQDAVASEIDGEAVGNGAGLEDGRTTSPDALFEAPRDRRLEPNEDQAHSRHLSLLLSIMSMAATLDWVSDHAVMKLVENWLLAEGEADDRRSVALDLTDWLTDLPDGAADEASLLRAAFERPVLQLGELSQAEFFRLTDLVVAGNEDHPPVASDASTLLAPQNITRDKSGGPDIVVGLGNAQADLVQISNASVLDGDDLRPVARHETQDIGLIGASEGASRAVRFVLQEVETLKVELSIRTFDLPQGMLVDKGHSLLDVVEWISAELDMADLPQLLIKDLLEPSLVTGLMNERDETTPQDLTPSGTLTGTQLPTGPISQPVEITQKDLTPSGTLPGTLLPTGRIDPPVETAYKDLTPSGTLPRTTEESQSSTIRSESKLERFDPRMEAYVKAFLKSSPTVEVLMVGGNVVILERNHDYYDDQGFGAMSWALDDGSTLSLIGILKDMPTFA